MVNEKKIAYLLSYSIFYLSKKKFEKNFLIKYQNKTILIDNKILETPLCSTLVDIINNPLFVNIIIIDNSILLGSIIMNNTLFFNFKR